MSSAAVEYPEDDHEHLEVLVRTPAGASHRFRLHLEELVARVVSVTIAYFVDRKELASGDYGLAVIRDGQAVPMADTSRLDEYHVTDQDVLVLVPEAPQVDG